MPPLDTNIQTNTSGAGETLDTNIAAPEPARMDCDICIHEFSETELSEYGSYEHVCNSCIDNEFGTCERCDDSVLNDSLSDVRLERGGMENWCEGCREDNASSCENCGVTYRNDLLDDDGYCDNCENPENVTSRAYSRDIIHDLTQGSIVKSMRTFGVELECDMNDPSKAPKAARKLPKTCGITRDGSVTGRIPQEVITPPIQGKNGEEYIMAVCETLAECDTTVNRSCGLHIHIGADDYIDNYDRLKKLFMFYLQSEDIIYSFLPKSRWNNRFCRKLADMYYLDEVDKIKTVERFEEVYYREQDPNRRDNRKHQKYDDARYTGVNFHALFHNGHTIEIRSHSGTVSAQKILHWVALHTSIIDFVLNATDAELYNETTKVLFDREKTQKERTEAFFKTIKLEQATQEYFAERQKKFVREYGKDDSVTRSHSYVPQPKYTPEWCKESEPRMNATDLGMFRNLRKQDRMATNKVLLQRMKELKKEEKAIKARQKKDYEAFLKSAKEIYSGDMANPNSVYEMVQRSDEYVAYGPSSEVSF